MTSTALVTLGALVALAASCAKAAEPVEAGPGIAAPEQEPKAPTEASVAPTKLLPVPDTVTRLHQNAFRKSELPDERPICFVTLHASAAAPATIYPLALFANGDVATWTQTSAGAEQPFFVKLSAADLVRATEMVASISRLPPARAREFEPSAKVMGASTFHANAVETRFFDDRQLPSVLAELVGLLKSRLEAENGPRQSH